MHSTTIYTLCDCDWPASRFELRGLLHLLTYASPFALDRRRGKLFCGHSLSRFGRRHGNCVCSQASMFASIASRAFPNIHVCHRVRLKTLRPCAVFVFVGRAVLYEARDPFSRCRAQSRDRGRHFSSRQKVYAALYREAGLFSGTATTAAAPAAPTLTFLGELCNALSPASS